MWTYEKRLQYPVKITRPNPDLATMIISQLGKVTKLEVEGENNWQEVVSFISQLSRETNGSQSNQEQFIYCCFSDLGYQIITG